VLLRLLTGDATLRVWLDGPQRQRVQLLDPFAEVAFVHDGRDVWTFDTGSNRGTHVVLPDEAGLRAAAERAKAAQGGVVPPSGAPTALTPQQLAEQLIALADPTTGLALGEPATVAGRAAYRLVMTPRTSQTLVARAVLAVDAENGLPLRVQVFARGHAEPVIDSGFEDVDYARPAAERFDFTPPAGAEVETVTVPVPDGGHDAAGKDGSQDGAAPPDVRVSGSGWASVVEVAPGADTDLAQLRALLADPMVQQFTTAVDGGRAVSTRLFSAMLTDDGRLLVGAVPVETLVAAAR
jgi:outer membrane lipoprotein-sorting protein